MGELVKAQDYENAKLAIKKFSEETTTDLDLKRVDDKKGVGEWLGDALFGGGIGLNHKVTGKELNELTVQIQSHLHSVNNTQIKLIKQFGEVYIALEALDREHIAGILTSIKATEKTSERIAATQEQIKKIVEYQKKTLEVLKKFKQKLDSYAHLGDIDKIWNDCQKWHKDISAISDSVSEVVSASSENAKAIDYIKVSIEDIDDKVTQLSETVKEQINQLESIIAFMNGVEAITHLKDVDAMWDSLTNAHVSLAKLCDELEATKNVVEKQQQNIENILSFIETMSGYEHLKEVDAMWGKVEDNDKKLTTLTEESTNTAELVKKNQTAIAGLNDYKRELSAIAHLKDVDNLWDDSEQHSNQIEKLQNQGEEARNLIRYNKEIIDQSFAVEKEKTDALLQQLNKKIQYAYWIAGGSMALALVELLVILLG